MTRTFRTWSVLTAVIMFAAPVHAKTAIDQAVSDIVAAQTKLHALRSVTATITTTMSANGGSQTSTGTVKCLKPNYIWIESRPAHGPTMYHISDGKSYCSNDAKGKWSSVKASSNGANFRQELMLWSDFYVLYAVDNAQHVVAGADVTIADTSVGGQPYEVITAVHKTMGPMTMSVYIDKADGLIHRMTVAGPSTMDITWTNWKLNPQLRPSQFKPKY